MKDDIIRYITDLFNVGMETSYEFKKLYGLTFVFIRKLFTLNNEVTSAEIKPAGIIYEENGQYYFAPLDDIDNIEEIIREFVKK